MTDDRHIDLASAYLDGEVTAAERARVEENPALGAEVDRLRVVRGMVADVPEPRVNVREQHLAAAFEAWDRIPAERDATPRGTRSERSRRSPTTVNRWMLASAAALVVVLAGGLTLRSLTDRDDTDDTTAEVADQPTADDAARAEAPAEVAEEEDSAEDTTATAEDESMALSEAVEVAEEEASDAETPDADIADTDTDPATDDAAAAPPPDDDLVVLVTSVDLASFAADALDADGELAAANADAIAGDESDGALPGDAQTIPPVDEDSLGVAELPECPEADLNIGPAVYDEVVVVVAVDEIRRWAYAYAIEDCQVMARARLDTAE